MILFDIECVEMATIYPILLHQLHESLECLCSEGIFHTYSLHIFRVLTGLLGLASHSIEHNIIREC